MSDYKPNSESISSPETKSEKLPQRQPMEASGWAGAHTKEAEGEPFVEIEIAGVGCELQAIPSEQPIRPMQDERRTVFYAMRQIARNDSTFYADPSKTFYHQAIFMKDFEDYYEAQEPFSAYYPSYHQMSHNQLRTYFTWRTQVRKGNVTDTSLSYAFLYIYELLNGIGVTDPEDGLNRLVSFWQIFRTFHTTIDRYILPWFKDYHIYYPIKRPFREFVSEYQLQKYYPVVFAYDTGRQDSFDVFAEISKYDIKKSVFYSDKTEKIINDCFYFLLIRIRKIFAEKEACFEDLIFYPYAKDFTWMPFHRALFYPVFENTDRQVVLSPREIYACRHNHWRHQSVMLSEQGVRLISYLMKEMECALRKLTQFNYKLAADPGSCDGKVRLRLEEMGISFPQFIRESVLSYYALSTRRIISVETESLKQIRKEALQTQEKLIIPEESKSEEIRVEQAILAMTPVASDGWTEFRESLTPIECEVLTLALRGEEIRTIAAQNMIMPEILADSINQKAMDCLGDIILELDDTIIIYDEYREKLMEMEKC